MSDQNEKFVTPITEKETMEFFCEGLKQASSAARELAVAQNNQMWARIAISCSELRLYGTQMARAKALSRENVLRMIEKYEKKVSNNVEEKKPFKLLAN